MQKLNGKALRLVSNNLGFALIALDGKVVASGKYFCSCCNQPTNDRRHVCESEQLDSRSFFGQLAAGY